MTELFIAVFSASVIIGVSTQLTHARHRGRVTSFSLGAMLLFVIISRIPSLDTPRFDINELIPAPEDAGEYYYVAMDAVCLGISEAVADEFDLSLEEVHVELINFELESIRCDTVVVTLRGAAALGDYKRIERYVDKIGIGRCRVDVQIG